MRRRLYTILWSLSFLLCLGAAALWLRSDWTEDQFTFTGPGSCYWRLVSSGQRRGSALVLIVGTGWPSWGKVPFYASARQWPHLPAEFCYSVSQPADIRFANRVLIFEHSTGGLRFGPDGTAWPYAWGALSQGPAVVPSDVRVPYYRLEIAHWAVVLLCGILPLARLVAHLYQSRRHRHRLQAGHCRQCGYDLRASKDRCPECGTPIRENADTHSQAGSG